MLSNQPTSTQPKSNQPTALIADDEPLLRSALARMLAATWPELTIVAQARNGREALEQYQLHKPTVCFLDIHMPGLLGTDLARSLLALAAGQISPWIRRHRRIGQWQGRVVGTIYIALGIRLAFQER